MLSGSRPALEAGEPRDTCFFFNYKVFVFCIKTKGCVSLKQAAGREGTYMDYHYAMVQVFRHAKVAPHPNLLH